VEFKALKFDLVKYVQDSLETTPTNGWWEYRNFQYYFFRDDKWKKYAGAEVTHWNEAVRREPDNRVAEGSTAAPLMEPARISSRPPFPASLERLRACSCW